MSLFDSIFKKAPKPKGEFQGAYRMLSAYEPNWTRWGGEIYNSEIVRASINAIATHISKLNVTVNGSAKPALRNKLKHGPNEFETWSQHLYRLATILYAGNTAFLVPVYDEYGEASGVYAVLPERCEIAQYNNVPYLRYEFSWGQKAAIELDSCGILTRFRYRSDFFGESNRALEPTMDLISIQDQGIKEGVKSAATYRFMAQLSNFSKAEDLAKERQRFTAENFSRDAKGGGLLLFPNTYSNIQQVKAEPFVADAETVQAIKNDVYEYFGVNEDILQNKAYGDKWAAFYEGCVEPFAIQYSEVMSKMFYTLRERSTGNFIMATSNRLQYMTTGEKLNVSAQMADRGILNRDEVREIWNLPPLPDGAGQVYTIRGEYYNADEKLTTEEGTEDGDPEEVTAET